jgi:hypothetical protein
MGEGKARGRAGTRLETCPPWGSCSNTIPVGLCFSTSPTMPHGLRRRGLEIRKRSVLLLARTLRGAFPRGLTRRPGRTPPRWGIFFFLQTHEVGNVAAEQVATIRRPKQKSRTPCFDAPAWAVRLGLFYSRQEIESHHRDGSADSKRRGQAGPGRRDCPQCREPGPGPVFFWGVMS